ncbi:MAG TPA: glycosyltransferase family 39 protein [Tepidisphaeraceae bacterium]
MERQHTVRVPHLILLGVILIGASCARWYDIARCSFWTDELLSLEVTAGHGYEHLDRPRGVIVSTPTDLTELRTAGSWGNFFESLLRGTHPPLYFCSLRLWRDLWRSDNDMVVRSFSAILSLLAIMLAFDAARQLHGTTTALWSAAILAFAGPQVEFAQEARGYSMLIALMMGCCAALARIETRGPSRARWVALLLCATAMPLTHYLGFVLLAVLLVYAVLRLRERSCMAALSALIGGAVLMGAIWGPWLTLQISGFSEHLSWLHVSRPWDFGRVIMRIGWVPLGFLCDANPNPHWLGYLSIILLMLPIVLLRRRPDVLLWVLIAWGVVLTIGIGDLMRGTDALAWHRYTLPAAAATCVLAAVVMSSIRSVWIRHVAPAVLVLACVLALPLSYDRDKPDWRQLATFVDRYCADDSTIVFFPNFQGNWYAGVLEIGLTHYSHDPKRREIVLENPADDLLVDRLRGAGMIDVVSGSDSPEAILPGCQVQSQAVFPGIGICSRVTVPPRQPIYAAGASSP